MQAAYIVETQSGFGAYDCWTGRQIRLDTNEDHLIDNLDRDKYQIVEDFATFRLARFEPKSLVQERTSLTMVYYDEEQDKWLSVMRHSNSNDILTGLTFGTFKDAKKMLEHEGWHITITNMQKVGVIKRTPLTTLTAEYEDLKHQLHEKAAEIINCLNKDEHGC